MHFFYFHRADASTLPRGLRAAPRRAVHGRDGTDVHHLGTSLGVAVSSGTGLGTGAGESSSLADVNVCNREDSIVRYENASFQK